MASVTMFEALGKVERWRKTPEEKIPSAEVIEVVDTIARDMIRMNRELEAAGDVATQVALVLNETRSGRWTGTDKASILRSIQLLANREKELARLKARMKLDEIREDCRALQIPRVGGNGVMERWDRTVAAFLEDGDNQEGTTLGHIGGDCFIGIVQRRHRLFLPGDLAILVIVNGQAERQRAWCHSARGYTVRDCYMQYAKWEEKKEVNERTVVCQTNRSLVRPVECPDHLVGRRPDDPDVRRFVVETLCAGDSAPG